jgi:hypothetical protein
MHAGVERRTLGRVTRAVFFFLPLVEQAAAQPTTYPHIEDGLPTPHVSHVAGPTTEAHWGCHEVEPSAPGRHPSAPVDPRARNKYSRRVGAGRAKPFEDDIDARELNAPRNVRPALPF